eukprot:TRINITY_DN7339_c0_g1_i5.p1 TRINITY_DN7339_c0_g1~~TRINITY_DN7339_c0_g1_i5.p1  ORF type:complete len:106 (+),score=9.23 TRINITY_DN7339_c0_g1_i5:387-704(+)
MLIAYDIATKSLHKVMLQFLHRHMEIISSILKPNPNKLMSKGYAKDSRRVFAMEADSFKPFSLCVAKKEEVDDLESNPISRPRFFSTVNCTGESSDLSVNLVRFQ